MAAIYKSPHRFLILFIISILVGRPVLHLARRSSRYLLAKRIFLKTWQNTANLRDRPRPVQMLMELLEVTKN